MLHLLPAELPKRLTPIPRPSDFRGNPLPVGHSVSEKIEGRRARLRVVGAEILARHGIDSAGMVHIARAAGIHPSTAMHAYPRRRDLLHDIVHTHIDTLHEIVGGTDDALEDHTPDARLEAVIAALMDGIRAHEAAHRLAHGTLSSLPPEVRDGQRHQYRLLVFRLGTIIERALPGLEEQRALFGPLARGLLAAISEAAFWFRDDGAFSRAEFAHLLACQTLAGGAAMIAAVAGAAVTGWGTPDRATTGRGAIGRGAIGVGTNRATTTRTGTIDAAVAGAAVTAAAPAAPPLARVMHRQADPEAVPRLGTIRRHWSAA